MSILGRVWCDVSSRACLAELSVLLRIEKFILFYSRVLRVVLVGVDFRVLKALGRGGGEGRAPGLMTSAVEKKVFNSYLYSFVFDVSSMGHPA